MPLSGTTAGAAGSRLLLWLLLLCGVAAGGCRRAHAGDERWVEERLRALSLPEQAARMVQAAEAASPPGVHFELVRPPPMNRDAPTPLPLRPEVRSGETVAARVRALREAGRLVAVEAFAADAGEGERQRAVRWDLARLEAIELPALRRALAEGADALLLAPTLLPAVTGDTLPLPLSAAAISGLLRRELGWEGLVMADLAALARGRDAGETAVAAVAAGVELLVNVENPPAVTAALVRAVETGHLPAARVEAAARRILTLEGRLQRMGGPTAPLPPTAETLNDGRPESARRLRPVRPAEVGMSEEALARVDATIRRAIEEGHFPGAALAVGRRGGLVRLRGYGRLDREPGAAAVDAEESLYDVASLTKVVGTTAAVMALVEDGQLALDAPAVRYLPEFSGAGKDSVTVRQLLAHSAGLPAGLNLYASAASPEEALRRAAGARLVLNPGEVALYSDLGFILLAEIVRRAAGEPMDRFLAWRLFAPLGMSSTMFLPPLALRPHTATSALVSERDFVLRGVVHDGNAFRLGGVAGHAGLFSTARDLAVFAQMLLNGGAYGEVRLFAPTTVAAFATRQRAARGRPGERALGWDTPGPESSAGSYFSVRSFGHTGYTGTSIWIDPERDLFVVLLTNRTYDRTSIRQMLETRREIHDGISRAITDLPLVRRPGAIERITPPRVAPPAPPPPRTPAPRSPPARRP